jgi:hypothetical protein
VSHGMNQKTFPSLSVLISVAGASSEEGCLASRYDDIGADM